MTTTTQTIWPTPASCNGSSHATALISRSCHMIGQGHGPAFITARCAQLFADGAPVIATDPHPDNTSAITAYAKCGFKPTGTVLDTDWGPCLPMTLNAPD